MVLWEANIKRRTFIDGIDDLPYAFEHSRVGNSVHKGNVVRPATSKIPECCAQMSSRGNKTICCTISFLFWILFDILHVWPQSGQQLPKRLFAHSVRPADIVAPLLLKD